MLRSLLILLLALPAHAATVGFSPGNAQQVVLDAITGAHKSIHVAAYSFTSKPIALALVAAHARGLDVRIVVDKGANGGKYSAATFTANHGVPTRVDGHYAIMHNKFMLIDGVSVETGSFNYTASAATRNAENALVIEDAELAAEYEREWRRLWAESADVGSRY